MSRRKSTQPTNTKADLLIRTIEQVEDHMVVQREVYSDKTAAKKNKISKNELKNTIMNLDEKLNQISSVIGEDELIFTQTEKLLSFKKETQKQLDEEITQYNSLLGELNEAVQSLAHKRVKIFSKAASSKIGKK